MSRLSLRARLVLSGTAAAAVVLLVALLVARTELTTMLGDADLRLAEADAAPYLVDLSTSPREHADRPSSGVLVAIRSPTGSWTTDSMPADVFDVPGLAPATTVDTGSAQFVVVRRTVGTADGTWTVWAARDTTGRLEQARSVDMVLLLTGLGLLACFAGATVLLVRGALRPVERLRARAAVLADDELLPVPPGGDELSRLAGTMNDLVGAMRQAVAHERRMIANASHELRTPIANLRTAVDLARRRPDAERLDALVHQADRLGDLAANLLQLSRLDEGAEPERLPARDVEDALLTAVDSWRTRLAGSRIDLDGVTTVPRPQALVRIDRIAVGRIVDNLVDNAVTALHGTGSITVSLRVDAGAMVLAVEDDGPGMSDAMRARAFDRFARGSSSGSGLGLALVRAVAVAGGGDARIESTAQGLRVVVAMPTDERV